MLNNRVYVVIARQEKLCELEQFWTVYMGYRTSD